MNASDLTLFAYVADTGSFNKAAEVAGISTPSLSKKISKLEKSLGAQLIHRTTRRLSLTEAGESLYVHAKNIEEQVNDAVASVSNASRGLSGTIKMSVPTISGELLLSEAIAEFCHQHPDISVDMRLDNGFANLIEEGLDLAIRTGILEDSSLIAKPLIQSNWIVCCSPDYINKYGEPETPDDLKTHNCLAYTYQAKGSYDWRFTHQGEELTVRISGSIATNNAQALRKAALAGFGIVYVPRCCVYEDLVAGKLTAILTDYQPRQLGVYAIYPYSKYLPQKLRLLIEHIKQAYLDKQDYF
ncbi:LysR family transcriptional regulator [Marinomonas mediterranea]|jgi:Transcriptional regulator|uniref:Transcriptional regulator, LysR family n=1 Tax=Marinomonas mediterranea (strain ATCC 700492 / JCM 21426 / NBRC 103028 / MMB-1) TaxID=717774 RepID=F2K0I2_MARM1|nr:LysR family transcriptional regulator [Marinomonas mediterranea]ADZ90966.1 transcriptional regulator, LysR family [Marinomonas mediterranea MMB-1]WCN09003.1 LysR family transcriptional regulator [Marinomonas mediterranea]WCN13037.1 LysR family transcriptional regulator [Marinomonas mediterranea]WCN17110.1 LysR family transcriptional regulator [Marinomonas mediterranea MMB-1]